MTYAVQGAHGTPGSIRKPNFSPEYETRIHPILAVHRAEATPATAIGPVAQLKPVTLTSPVSRFTEAQKP